MASNNEIGKEKIEENIPLGFSMNELKYHLEFQNGPMRMLEILDGIMPKKNGLNYLLFHFGIKYSELD